jgi:Domain of unknown function (DUF4126)
VFAAGRAAPVVYSHPRPTLPNPSMKLVLDILQGMGLAAAAGLRPFLPTLVAGAFATADVGVDYDGTAFSFLESPIWLLAIAIAMVVTFIVRGQLDRPAGNAALQGIAIGLGGILFAATLDDNYAVWWPGLIGGLLIAALAGAAVRDLFTRVRGRLDHEAAAALPIYGEAVAVVLAALAILIPPVSIIAIGFLIWLLVGGRRREGQKYAGLRILR